MDWYQKKSSGNSVTTNSNSRLTSPISPEKTTSNQGTANAESPNNNVQSNTHSTQNATKSSNQPSTVETSYSGKKFQADFKKFMTGMNIKKT
jgi:hypothetical protein